MALTFDQLVAMLTPAAGNLTVSAAQLDTPAITQLWTVLLANAELVLTNVPAPVVDTEQHTVTLSGSLANGDFPGLQQGLLQNGLFAWQPDGSVTARLPLAVNDPSWTLPDSFPALTAALADVWQLSAATFTLDSSAPTVLPADFRSSFGYPDDLATVAAALVPGLTLAATVALSPGPVASLMAQVAEWPLAMSGPVSIFPFAGNQQYPAPLLMPTLLLQPQPADVSGNQHTLLDNYLEFIPQLAVLLQEVSTVVGPLMQGVMPSPVLAVRCLYTPSAGWDPIPVSAFFYDPRLPRLTLITGTAVSQNGATQQSGSVADLTALLNGADNIAALMSLPGLPAITEIDLTYVRVSLNTAPLALENMLVVFSIGQQQDWSLFGGLITVQDLTFSMAANVETDSWTARATLEGNAYLFGNPSTTLNAYLVAPTLEFQCTLAQTWPDDRPQGEPEPTSVSINSLVDSILGDSHSLPTLSAAVFQLKGNVRAGNYQFEAVVQEDWPLTGSLSLQSIRLLLGIEQVGSGSPFVYGNVSGLLQLGNAVLSLSADYDSSGEWVFSGEALPASPGNPLNLSDLVAALAADFGYTAPPLPEIDLNDLRVEYRYVPGGTSSMAVWASLVFVDASIDLTALPLIGSYLDPGDSIALDSLTLVFDTAGSSSLTLGLRIGSTPQTVQLLFDKAPVAGGLTRRWTPTTGALYATDPAPGVGAYSPAGTWLNIQRTVGPVTVEKIGFQLKPSGLAVLINASLAVSAFKAQVLGLGVQVPLQSPYVPEFTIDGLSISFSTPALTVAGAFLKTATADYLEFSGELQVRAGGFALTALGSYATTSPPSLFAFVMVNAPIGGPSYCYINGLSGGFGYNRNLLLPPIDQVTAFPLVAGARPGSQNPFGGATTPVQVMDTYLGVEMGQNWLAAGLSVASFGMVQASVLLTVAFGNRLQLGLLGVGTVGIPARAEKPVVYVELALEATFVPDEGLLAVYGQLTSNSYVFEPACHLAGGFALCLWLPPSPYAGDFVLTVGGYNPQLTRPANYPAVPLVGLRWQVAPELSLKGGAYLALTPHVVMAGGSLEGLWSSSTITVNFKAWADFLMYWKPFHYDVVLGVTFNVSASLQVGFVRVSLAVSVGADLHLWGPDFRYRAHIDLDVLSFTIGNEEDDARPTALGWNEFRDSFLSNAAPAGPAPAQLAPAAGTDGDAASTVLNLRISRGLLQSLSNPPTAGAGAANAELAPDFLVDPQQFALTAQTLVPARSASYNATALAGGWNTAFGIGPMQVAAAQLTTSTLAVAISCYVNGAYVPYNSLLASPSTGLAPKGLWLYEAQLAPALNEPMQLDNVLQGLELLPLVPTGGTVQGVAVAGLIYDDAGQRHTTWGSNPAPTSNSFGADAPDATVAATIGLGTPAGQARAALLADLYYNGFQMPTTLDPSPMTDADTLALLNPYVLSYLGEATSY